MCDTFMWFWPCFQSNCRCALPHTGLFFFKSPAFYYVENSTIYNSLQDSLMAFFQKARLHVDSVSIKNHGRSSEDYLVINLGVYPPGAQPWFNRTGIIAKNYANFFTEISETGGTRHKLSNTGVTIDVVVGGSVLVSLLVLAGVYALRWKGQAESIAQPSEPFDILGIFFIYLEADAILPQLVYK